MSMQNKVVDEIKHLFFFCVFPLCTPKRMRDIIWGRDRWRIRVGNTYTLGGNVRELLSSISRELFIKDRNKKCKKKIFRNFVVIKNFSFSIYFVTQI